MNRLALDLSLPRDEEEDDLLAEVWKLARPVVLARGAVDERLSKYRDDPLAFGREVLGHDYWPAQEAILRAIGTHRLVTVRGPRKCGKSFAVADAVNWMAATGPSITITLAPRFEQVRDVIWSRVLTGRARSRVPLPGEAGVVSIRVAPQWYAKGTSTNDPKNMLGAHAEIGSLSGAETLDGARIFLVFEEALGVEQSIFDVMEGSLVGKNAYCVLLGNPDADLNDPHKFVRSHMPGSGYHRIRIAAHAMPDDDSVPAADEEFVGGIPERLMPREWIAERARDWGEESPMYRSHVGGQFWREGTGSDLFLPRRLLLAGLAVEKRLEEQGGERHLGVDVAAGGADRTVAALNVGGRLADLREWSTPDTMETVQRVVALTHEWNVAGKHVHVDATGVGKGVVDRLRERGMPADAVDFGGAALYDWERTTGATRFKNRKAELFWVVRRAFEEGQACVPDRFREVWRQAAWHSWLGVPSPRGTEIACADSKATLRERYGKSPDEWDAWCISWSRRGAHAFSSSVVF